MLDNAKLDNAKLNNAKLDNAKLDNAKLDNTKLDNAKLDNAKLDNAKLDNAKLDKRRQPRLKSLISPTANNATMGQSGETSSAADRAVVKTFFTFFTAPTFVVHTSAQFLLHLHQKHSHIKDGGGGGQTLHIKKSS
jgi:hypothetical protein